MDRLHRPADRIALEDQVWLDVCFNLARLGTCARRQVGCVFLNDRGHVVATGRNGVAAGEIHCVDVPCAGAGLPSGTGLSACDAIHAEVNAVAQCKDVWAIDTIYCTDSPCVDCVKLLRNTSARRIVFARLYPHLESRAKWLSSRPGRTWEHVPQTGENGR